MKKTDTPSTTPPEPGSPANAFATTLAQLDRGASLAELSLALTELVQACRATGKKGELKYSLIVKPIAGTSGMQVMCMDELKTKVPLPDRRPTLFFTDETGALSRKDPNQRDWIEEQREAEERARAREAEGKITLDQIKAAAK